MNSTVTGVSADEATAAELSAMLGVLQVEAAERALAEATERLRVATPTPPPARPKHRVPWAVLVVVFAPLVVVFGSYAGAMLGSGRRDAGLLALLLLLLTLFILAAVWHEWKGPSAQKEQPRDH